jgi:L-ribulose-5-phosphate 3-epimerase
MYKIGFMQGRLSEVVDGKIQAFPWQFWKKEFNQASEINIPLMEWTLDQSALSSNPLMTADGRKKIMKLCEENDLVIPSLTGDCFMQAPFWKSTSNDREGLINDFNEILYACGALKVNIIVVPLVDGGAITSKREEKYLIDIFSEHESVIASNGVKIAFESDYTPVALKSFIEKMNPKFFGINYDIGNSSSLGFNANEEFYCYGDRILNVHVKDRTLGGTTVPLGYGDADFECVFRNLYECGYKGNYILQTARDPDGQHSKAIAAYRDKTVKWISTYES